jgi:RNA polymerase subunit RPABC4/transcription elongation factor Spt4
VQQGAVSKTKMKHCPKCGSSRIRRGYAPDPLIVRMMGFRELLCDGCNLRFRGFVIPGTLPRSNRHNKKPEEDSTSDAKLSGESTRTTRPRSEAKSCPKCHSESTHRSHRQGVIENLTSLLRIYPYRCDDCNMRFLSRRRPSTRKAG